VATATAGLLVWATCVDPALTQNRGGAPAAWIPSVSTPCAFSAWTSFQADAPIPVRNGPSPSADIVGYLPVAADEDEEGPASIEFDVVEAGPDGLKIDNASDPVEPDDAGQSVAPREFHRGAGWIANDMIQFGVQSSLGYARPDPESPIVLDIGSDWLTDSAYIDAVRGCSGEWVLLDYTLYAYQTESGGRAEYPLEDRKKGTAWFRGLCANQYTTCDMSSVDRR